MSWAYPARRSRRTAGGIARKCTSCSSGPTSRTSSRVTRRPGSSGTGTARLSPARSAETRMSKVRQPRLGEPVRADSGVDGQLKAAGALGRTVLNPDVQRVLDDYRRLNTDEARARYADHFLSRTAHVMDEIWPAFYELLKRVEDGKLYSDPAYLGEGRTFGT